MQEWDPFLRDLADTPSDYNRDAGDVILVHHGQEHVLSLKEVSGVGLSIKLDTGKYIHISSYIQTNLLDLPRLSNQITRALERIQEKRPGKFIEGPADYEYGFSKQPWKSAYFELMQNLKETEPDTTRIIQLMAAAGKGKTVLLENVALNFAKSYQPEPNPLPIILPIDLLGRYIGNIDDAIAGSLNNTYLFPNLTQRDVIMCMKKRWIILALDGFDELVARIGVRDAFLRISELIDQLSGNGVIFLSARESFFDLYQITSGIRTYLQTKTGTYSTSVIRLSSWDEKQGIEVFSGLGSKTAKEDLYNLLKAFEGDKDIVFHPFFLTRLATLWLGGERFEQASGQADTLSRSKYVIETFIKRESIEKWKDKDGNPVLDVIGHSEMLGTVAEEMWRSGAFTLNKDELKIAAEIGLTEADFPRIVISEALERIGTHAALQTTPKGFTFLHDRFLHYFLGFRLYKLLSKQSEDLLPVLSARELPPSVIEWIFLNINQNTSMIALIIEYLNRLSEICKEGIGSQNIGYLSVQILNNAILENIINITNQILVGEALASTKLQSIIFKQCKFWSTDFDNIIFTNIIFNSCKFGDIRIAKNTKFVDVKFIDCTFTSVEIEGQGTFFNPEEIFERLKIIGISIEESIGHKMTERLPQIREDILKIIEIAIKYSERTCDVAVEELSTESKILNYLIRTGVENEVLREITKDVSGPHKRFIRFSVDRNKLLRGNVEIVGDRRIDEFWNEIRTKYPLK